MTMSDEVRAAERAWTRDRVRILLEGRARILTEQDGEEWYEYRDGPTANDRRLAAYAGARQDLIDDCILLEEAVAQIVDDGVRHFMLLRLRTDVQPDLIADFLGEERPWGALQDRGEDLVLRSMKQRRRQVARVRGLSGPPVCWQCMQEEVECPGMTCGPRCRVLRPRRGPHERLPVQPDHMSAQMRRQEIHDLATDPERQVMPSTSVRTVLVGTVEYTDAPGREVRPHGAGPDS